MFHEQGWVAVPLPSMQSSQQALFIIACSAADNPDLLVGKCMTVTTVSWFCFHAVVVDLHATTANFN